MPVLCLLPLMQSLAGRVEVRQVGQAVPWRGRPGSSAVPAAGKGCVPVAVVKGRSAVSF